MALHCSFNGSPGLAHFSGPPSFGIHQAQPCYYQQTQQAQSGYHYYNPDQQFYQSILPGMVHPPDLSGQTGQAGQPSGQTGQPTILGYSGQLPGQETILSNAFHAMTPQNSALGNWNMDTDGLANGES